jgi:uncharacterized flavoprotein (TIGR03862 family)
MGEKQVAIIGGGPAGLMAAEILSSLGHAVTVYEAMPTVARKLLMAGKSGLNITHAEEYGQFVTRFGSSGLRLQPIIDAFTPNDLRFWVEGLGQQTFTGTSGRVFPKSMKASPLLRAWLTRLEKQNVRILTRHRWQGFSPTGLLFHTPDGDVSVSSDAVLLAVGGASWPRLGSDAAWVPWVQEKEIEIAAFRPANCGFDVGWSESFRARFAGAPLKSVMTTSGAGTYQGEFVVTKHGIEGSLVYAHSASLRDALERSGQAGLVVDLAPGRTLERLAHDLDRQAPKDSFSNRLRKATGLTGIKAALLRELIPEVPRLSPPELATLIKALPLPVISPRPIAEAISSAGGIAWDEIDGNFMLKSLPGIFVAGEMIDWEAPTGGYLLTACLATGRAAARGIDDWLRL